MAFASAVHDPNPVYLDDARPGGLVGPPGLVFSLQWQSRHAPDQPIDLRTARYGVHAFSDVRFERPFREGDVITCQGETIAIRQIPPGVLSVQRYTMVDSSGETVAVMDHGGITRGAVTRGPDRGAVDAPPLPEPSDIGATVWTAPVEIEPDAAHVYSECADIYNPIHTERRVALAAGLPDIILHGSATLCIALREVIDRSLEGDPTRVTRLAGRLRAMVLLGTAIEVRCLEDRRGAAGEREIFFDVLNQEGQPAIANGLVVARA